jgi:hypothetical protein
MDKDVIWARSSEGLQKLRPGPAVEPPPACAAPFVYLYDTSNKNADDFTYPTTRKALATFPGVSDLGLVELKDSGPTSLGITVPSKAVGEAVIAHLKQAMKDEAPVLTCLEAPKKMRKIEIEPAGKK